MCSRAVNEGINNVVMHLGALFVTWRGLCKISKGLKNAVLRENKGGLVCVGSQQGLKACGNARGGTFCDLSVTQNGPGVTQNDLRATQNDPGTALGSSLVEQFEPAGWAV